ncbi:RNA polymerase sigma factor, sigma-70 family [Mycobacterium sp. JS623]|uniref:sigma-70 family RNA polymerase sigma factor n=1 Tax=Mycobacterium sp. JS623 TaxID=212767 RepID=UPI0002A57AAD|nr:sigma-70 family RNA polymerase sigma factor [Mycobacterium sp. JS623]AGB24576.1 RNA polymerase sigma factor, sigma-70 family [Mycobacterium sp. JS623]
MASTETEITAADFAGCSNLTVRSERKLRHDRAAAKTEKDREAATVKGLYDGHAAALWCYACRLTGDPARAQDVVQETLLRAWQHPEVANDTERSARSWLFTVARNMIIDESRSLRSRREVSALNSSGTPERTCPDNVNATLDRVLVGEALARLTPDHRTVVRRAYLQGWTTAQIAADLRIADGTVKSRLHYALRALRLVLREMGYTSYLSDTGKTSWLTE